MIEQQALDNMIKQQLRTGDVVDDLVLGLFNAVPRSCFVPTQFKSFAYSDMQIPLAHQQRMMTPLEEGTIIQALALQKNQTVLEVGTGTGYLTALLSKMAKQVTSIDYFSYFTGMAQKNLAQFNCDNIELITGDAYEGWYDKAPFDVVVLTGAVPAITKSHRLQVLPGGKLLAIVGKIPALQCIMLTLDHANNWTETILFETALPPLINTRVVDEFVF